jgi:enoyl-CoA hydratase
MPGDVTYEVGGHVGIVTLNRPEVHNALRRRTYEELTGLVRSTTARVSSPGAGSARGRRRSGAR